MVKYLFRYKFGKKHFSFSYLFSVESRRMVRIIVTPFSTVFICVLIGAVFSGNDIRQPIDTVDDNDCPPWFIYDTSLNQCVCSSEGSFHVKCTNVRALLRFGSCMTYDKEDKGTSVARCQYFMLHGRNVTSQRYIELPQNVSDLNEYMCGPMNRKGLVCSECIEGFGPSLTSIGYQCANCTNAWYGVPLFLFLEFVPITIFYLIILSFRINLTTAPMTSFVLFCQLAVYTFASADPESRTIMQQSSFIGYQILIYLSSFYGIWNLDFFRYIMPSFCISENLKIVHVAILSYISAFYPLFLIGVTYMCIKLYSSDYEPVLWLRGQVRKHFRNSKVKPDTKHTIVDVFASFLLLSYTKLMLMFSAFLGFAKIVNSNGSMSRTNLDIDPSISYFSGEHIPFLLLALFVLIGPVLLSALLLTLYPIKTLRSLILKCRFGGHSKAALNIFVEKFHNCYRDGLDGGRDMRSFAGLYFLIRALGVIITAILPPFVYGETTWLFESVLFGGSSLLIAIVRPYKKTYMNIIDALVLFNISLLSALLSMFYTSARSPGSTPFSPALMLALVGSWPIIGFVVAFLVFVHRSKQVSKWISNIKRSCCTCIGRRVQSESVQQNSVGHICDEELPDRFVHPDNYEIEVTNEALNPSSPVKLNNNNISVY